MNVVTHIKTALRLFSLCILLSGCKKKDIAAPDPCNGHPLSLQISKTESVAGSNNGTINILSPRGDTISYKLSNGSFQNYPYYSNLAPGDYTVIAKNTKGCSDTVVVTILNYGAKYAAVKQLINGYCGPCHLNGAVSGGKNFDTDASIVASKDRIRIRTIDGIPTFMPQNSQLTSVDKQKIVDWINAGGTTSN